MRTESVKVPLKDGRILMLKFSSLGDELEIDQLLQIDMQNLLADIITFPVLLNKVGLLLADANNAVSEAEINLRIWQAKKRERVREEMLGIGEKPTDTKVEDKVRIDPQYLVHKKILFNKQKLQETINSLFWSMKDKSGKLDKISLTIQAGDVAEMMVNSTLTKFNGVELKLFEPLIH